MVRAGRDGALADDFRQHSLVAVGFLNYTDLSDIKTPKQLRELVREAFPEFRPGQVTASASQLARFLFEFAAGDRVVTYDPEKREYLIGSIVGSYRFQPGAMKVGDDPHPHVREVQWLGTVSRDELSTAAKNSLGAISTIFLVPAEIASELERRLSGAAEAKAPTGEDVPRDELELLREETAMKAHEFIKDRVVALDWDQMQQLVAGILRAMGYKTRVSPRGKDLGRDIVASPDGLGLESPRIVVEVKHRPKEQIGAPGLRSFLGGLRSGDRGLYVSTGGFTQEAKYEADRATVPVTLLDVDEVVRLLVENYELLDTDTRALMPLIRLYWPAAG